MDRKLDERTHIAVYGAGSIGCFIGGLLLLAGRRVTFLARPRIAAELATHGLFLTDFAGLEERIGPEEVDVQTSAKCLSQAGLVLLAVKSGATQEAASEIAALTPPCTAVVSLQNGIENPAILRAQLGQKRVAGSIVGFNVVHKGHGVFHRGTSGDVVIQEGFPDILDLLSVPGLKISASSDIEAVQWGKLLFNLNNGLNALSNLPLRQELESPAWRHILADQITEGLEVLAAAGIKPVATIKAPLRFVPSILRLPNALFRIVAQPMLQIDPVARSSAWDDLTRRRVTEIDHLQGVIVRLAREHGRKAPLSEAILQLVKEAESAGAGPPGLTPADIRSRLKAGRASKAA